MVTLEGAGAASISTFDHALVAARREAGDKPAEPKSIHLLNVRQGQAGSVPLGFACSAILGGPGAEEVAGLQRSQVTNAARMSDVTRIAISGLRGYALEYERDGVGSAFFVFDSEPWTVVCGGSFDAGTSFAFRRVIESLSELR